MPINRTFTAGDDVYTTSAADTYQLDFLAGNDRLTINAGTVRAAMGDGADQVVVRSLDADISGDAGNDRFSLYASRATLGGGLGDDRFDFGANVNWAAVSGGDGNDRFYGYNHVISGAIRGEGGNDVFTGFANYSWLGLYGGTGNDVYQMNPASPALIYENLGEGTDTVQVGIGVSYTLGDNLENLVVSSFATIVGDAVLTGNGLANHINGSNYNETFNGAGGNDTLSAKGGDDRASGGDGNDLIDGGTGDDALYGDAGNDTLIGRAGQDMMTGGVGNDLYYVDHGGDAVLELADEGTDTIRVDLSLYVLPDHVETGIIISPSGGTLYGNVLANNLSGSAQQDWLYGEGGHDAINGGNGDDRIDGGDGSDILLGGAGNDILKGGYEDFNGIGSDSDLVDGGAGMDTLVGDYNQDVMRGGADADIFVFNEWYLAVFDIIQDFEQGVDSIDLSAIDANEDFAGNQGFTFVSAPSGGPGELWIVAQGDDTYAVVGNVDADSSPELNFLVHMTTAVAPTASDFAL